MTTAAFWTWFQENNEQYLNLEGINNEDQLEALLDAFLEQLHGYCGHLFFRIGGKPNGVRELVITAEGDLKYFDEVEQLVAAAPELSNWKVVAFKQARPGDFKARYEDVVVASNETWFMPLENVSIAGLAIRLHFKDYDESNEENFMGAAYQVLDTLLGEKLCAETIRYVEVAKLIGDEPEDELLPLHDLPEFIEWYNAQA